MIENFDVVDRVTANYALNFLADSRLERDYRFFELKSRLEDFYQQFYSDSGHLIHPGKNINWHKHFYKGLHLLLTETVLTADREKQLESLENTYTWYISNVPVLEKSPNQSPKTKLSIVALPLLAKRKQSQILNIPNRKSPKKSTPTKEEILEKISKNYQDMLDLEKIHFSTGKTLNKRVEGNFFLKPGRKVEEFSEKASITPDVFVHSADQKNSPFVHDFRVFSHKARVILPGKAQKSLFNQTPATNAEVLEIDTIKFKLAQKRIGVSAKVLECALYTHDELPYDRLTPSQLPRGGDSLIKARHASLPLKSQKTLRKRKK